MSWFNDAANREREQNKTTKVEVDIAVEQDLGRDRCVIAHVVTEVDDPVRREDVQSKLN